MEHVEPTGTVPGAAVDELELPVDVAVDEGKLPYDDDVSDGFRSPLQNPSLHRLKAHCKSEVQVAWKLPQAGISIELVA